MQNDKFSTPITATRSYLPTSTSVKRDSLAAELERDPQLSTAKRKQRTHAFHSQMSFASLERQVASLQTSKAELEAKLREKDAAIERLEGDRRYLADREKEEREEKERERKEREEEKRKLSSDLRALRNSYQALSREHDDLQEAQSTLQRQTSHTIASQKAEITTLSRQLDLLQKELVSFQDIAEQRRKSVEELQNQVDELAEAQANTSRLSVGGEGESKGEDENWAIIREELHRQANHLRTVESANVKMTSELNVLRQRNTSLEVLREQKRELEKKVEGMEQLKEKVVRLEAELDAARKEREDWASKSTSTQSVAVTRSLSELRLKYATLLEEHGSNVALLHRREKELEEMQERELALENQIEALESGNEALNETLVRAEQRATLAEREVGFQQAMLASFTAEETAHGSENSSRLDEMTKQRVGQLESLLSEYKDSMTKMEAEIHDLTGDPSTNGDRRPRAEIIKELEIEQRKREVAEEALKILETNVESQLEQIDKLEQTLFELQGEMGGGRHIPPGIRVLCMRDNPASQWEDLSRKALDRVKDENEALLRRLKELEESGVRGEGGNAQQREDEELVPRKSWEVLNERNEELVDELKQRDKRLLRLRQVFAAKTDEFKDAIASILGVKLAFYPNGQVRVTSQFDLNAAFVFQPTKVSSGAASSANSQAMTMKLVAKGDGGPEELPQLMRYWVEQEQCIPGFLSSVTLECYEKMKREGGIVGA
ncbi:hypothetical protein QCA50_001111 [Cerrena zonata]|uniref:Spindle assembly checkpoint component MAD1 n=1 Tax=Cerrena zonata TaxID=2478898 RepID=A0AAW0GXZ5_9APHY